MFWTEMTLKRAKRHACGGEGGRIHWGRWGIGLVSCSMRPRSAYAVEEEARPTQPNTSRRSQKTPKRSRWYSHHGLAITGAANAGMTQHYSIPATKQASYANYSYPCNLQNA
ncbi:uncharacterized protein CLUP02_16743 [Colletotrichum lupini]|uniref:Uncharacterized protein n=1 Tax=Colletotrichum lupini TaxID=145971 RepID=A0A9Q8WPU2_9PEZI|nr:uncharacterized protein CLUP02_16743 [Colletotrichum lupini]UQC91209.1 hypothetical protein CLUP02_16743 [Colletotrichum lupini]